MHITEDYCCRIFISSLLPFSSNALDMQSTFGILSRYGIENIPLLSEILFRIIFSVEFLSRILRGYLGLFYFRYLKEILLFERYQMINLKKIHFETNGVIRLSVLIHYLAVQDVSFSVSSRALNIWFTRPFKNSTSPFNIRVLLG